MAPLPQPGPPPQLCPRCRIPLPEPKPTYCPNCGAPLQERPIWLTVIAALGVACLGLIGLCLGGLGVCIAALATSETYGTPNPDLGWIWVISIAGVLCGLASLAILVWLLKKPKR